MDELAWAGLLRFLYSSDQTDQEKVKGICDKESIRD